MTNLLLLNLQARRKYPLQILKSKFQTINQEIELGTVTMKDSMMNLTPCLASKINQAKNIFILIQPSALDVLEPHKRYYPNLCMLLHFIAIHTSPLFSVRTFFVTPKNPNKWRVFAQTETSFCSFFLTLADHSNPHTFIVIMRDQPNWPPRLEPRGDDSIFEAMSQLVSTEYDTSKNLILYATAES